MFLAELIFGLNFVCQVAVFSVFGIWPDAFAKAGAQMTGALF